MQEGFQKIDLEVVKKVNLAKPSPKSIKSHKLSRVIFIVFMCGLLALIILAAALIIPGKDLYISTQKTAQVAKETFAAIKNQDIDKADVKLTELKDNIEQVKLKLDKLSWAKYIPFLGAYVTDAQHLVQAGIACVEAGQITTSTILPYSDLLGLKGKSTFVAGSADERIKTAVETLDKVTPKIDEIAQKITIVGNELNQIDPQRYPGKLGSMPIKGTLISAESIFQDTAKLFVEATPLLKKIPELLGSREQKSYLILFQNDAELRATGGFITAYAIFKVEKGKMQVIKAEDIYKLDEAKRKSYPAPPSILKYHKNVTNWELRDSNLSPDFVVSMKEFEKMLSESVPDFPKFDGIIALDTHVLVGGIRILGEFNIYGRKFSAENDPRCDCPKAIYELEDYATRPVAYVREERKDIIGVLMYQLMQRALGVSPSQYWGRLFQMFLDETKQKHVLFYFHDQNAQQGIEALNFAGHILPFEGDYLQINNVNFAGAKSNMFIKENVEQDINIGNDGTITKQIIINYKNPAPASNCNLEAGQLCLNGILRNWLRVYVPQGSKLIDFSGSEMETVTYDELGKTVFEGFLTVKPQGGSEVKVKYILPFRVKKGEEYKLLIQKQPGTDQDDYTVNYNGKQIEKFPLLIDKNISAKF